MEKIKAERRSLLLEKLRALYKEYDYETRKSEKFRIKAEISDVEAEIGALGVENSVNHSKPRIIVNSDRLPQVPGGFFGRLEELEILTSLWKNNEFRIVQLVAAGGTGKTKLLREWIDKSQPDSLLAWSFHSQSADNKKQISATSFFIHAFEKFGIDDSLRFSTEEDKGEKLAQLIAENNCLLVLDGLEPLQHTTKGMRGELKDRALSQLLNNLAGQKNGFCIITTRLPISELDGRLRAKKMDLSNLKPDDGLQLLRSLGVNGGDVHELRKVVQEFGCHALALHLLGNLLRMKYGGDIYKRHALKYLSKDLKNKTKDRVNKLISDYEEWLTDKKELALLYLLGLFYQPISEDVLQVLWEEKIPCLTANIDEDEWEDAIQCLRSEHQIVFISNDKDRTFDCHPLIRNHFGERLREKFPEAWKQAHLILFSYYRKEAPDAPDSVEDMFPLFKSIEHACLAGLHQQAFDEIYWRKISRGKDAYLMSKGFYTDDLAVLAHFFKKPWTEVYENLQLESQAKILRSAAFRLRASGRVKESLKSFKKSYDLHKELNDPKEIDLIEPLLTLGKIKEALQSANSCNKVYIDKPLRKLECLSIYARTLHQAGQLDKAHEYFKSAEMLCDQVNSSLRYLNSIHGFRYCELLMERNEFDEVISRSKYILDSKEDYPKEISDQLELGLYNLLLGRTYIARGDLRDAIFIVNKALASLREAGNQDHLPRGLLTRAFLYRKQKEYDKALIDLQEVYNIADYNMMKLHLTDYHLEMARLSLDELQLKFNIDEEELSTTDFYIDRARGLIKKTGYLRRMPEFKKIELRRSRLNPA